MRAVIGPLDSLRITAGGKPRTLSEGTTTATDLRIESARILLTCRRAELTLRGRALTLRPKP